MCDFFGRLFRSSNPASDIIATKDETELASLPPPYEELPRLLPSTELPLSVVRSLKRCLIWRMAIDLGLKWYVPRIERPSDNEYARFESCWEDYGKYLGDHFVSEESLRNVNDSLWLQIFLPGSEAWYTWRPAGVLHVLNSRIIVNLVTNPHGAFARRLKANCAKLHRKNFSWLLDPALINTDNILRARPASIHSGDTEVGHWKQAVLLMEECERPCAALMESSLSTMWRAMTGYFFTDANIRQQPGFINAATRVHTDRLPTAVGFGLWAWWNPDQTHVSYSKRIVGR
ncbi:hypothetical protein D6D01_07141 [Aureobasidium pullulans]|uniref:Uncharacterized protein n=1 Tax=Aureobasidium pullulans TaxID=5580 RepID=A0A4S9KT38_AURPU|nr:hypothetical protein D6D01_07141 [Aureobasidium pullulans]